MASLEPALRVEVAYAKPAEQIIVLLNVAKGATVQQAIEWSGIINRFPEIKLAENKVGIFSKPVKLSEPVRDGDRVEIYRPLIADPKAVRKQRAADGKRMKKGGGNEA